MTAQDLLYKAVKLIDDYPNKADYEVDFFDDITTVQTELIRAGIGVKSKEYAYEILGTETVADGYRQIPLPTDLTEDDQILEVICDGYKETTTVSDDLVLLVAENYYGAILAKYVIKAPQVSALGDTLVIPDDAVNLVARFGLAELLSMYNKPQFTDRLSAKYEKAKKSWKRRDYNYTEVQDYYGGLDG